MQLYCLYKLKELQFKTIFRKVIFTIHKRNDLTTQCSCTFDSLFAGHLPKLAEFNKSKRYLSLQKLS